MKKTLSNLILSASLISIILGNSSCATILGGQVSECQRTRPSKGEPTRKLRAGALIADIILGGVVFTGIDFLTCAIYKPCDKK